MTVAGKIAWAILFTNAFTAMSIATKIRQLDDGLGHVHVALTKEHSNVATGSHTDTVTMKAPFVVAETVHRPTSPVPSTSAASNFAPAAAAGDSNDALAFRDADTPAREYYGKKVNRVLPRDRRALTFPSPSTLLLIFGLGTPLQLDRESVIVGSFAKIIYALPENSTDFTEPGVYFARTKSRWSIYKVLERAAELYGFGAGKGCLLRAICEVSAAPFDLHHGLFGQMAQAFLSPSSTREPYDEYTDQEYHAAESLGKHVGENCHALYSECERSVLDVFSTTAAMLGEATTPTTTPTTTNFSR